MTDKIPLADGRGLEKEHCVVTSAFRLIIHVTFCCRRAFIHRMRIVNRGEARGAEARSEERYIYNLDESN